VPEKIERIVVHHSASPFGNALLIDRWHRERGWKEIGYHAVILNGRPYSAAEFLPWCDGEVETGRQHNFDDVIVSAEIGAHAQALGMNAKSLGVCLIGSKHTEFTAPQLRALIDWLRQAVGRIRRDFGIEARIVGHKEIDRAKPECPALDMERVRELAGGRLDHRIFDDRALLTFLEPVTGAKR